jgi:1-acyl-sn-glycerol-3-phosphate acyltransferase
MSPAGAFGFALLLLLSLRLQSHRRTSSDSGELTILTRWLWWVNAFYCVAWHRLRVEGADRLPATGPALLISNHTCCIDHMLLQAGTRRVLGFLIARELYERPLFRPFCSLVGCIPVRRDGKDVYATRSALRALEQGRVVPVFPEGKITPESGRVLGEGRPGIAFLALHARVPVVPAYICGTPPTNKVWPSYRTPSNARVYFGEPIDLSEFTTDGASVRDRLDEVTERLMGAIRALKDQAEGAGATRALSPRGEGLNGEPGSHGQRPDSGSRGVSGGCAAVGRA